MARDQKPRGDVSPLPDPPMQDLPGPMKRAVSGVTDLERLTLCMSENETRAARLGYALGLLHGADEDRAPEIDLRGPEMRVIEDMDLG